MGAIVEESDMAVGEPEVTWSHRILVRGVLTAGAALVLLLAAGCGDDDSGIGPIDADRIDGSGDVVTETREVAAFDRVVLGGEGAVVIREGEDESLTVETDDNLLEYIESSVSDGTLEIRTTEGVDIAPTDSVLYEIGMADVTGIELLGAGSIEIERWSADGAEIALGGAGEIVVGEFDGTRLTVDFPGVGEISISGAVDHQDVTLAGVGEYGAGGLESLTARVEASGTGTATVWAVDSLEATATGVGVIQYYGDPELTEQVGGVATIVAMGDK
jgi:hypothetical protein